MSHPTRIASMNTIRCVVSLSTLLVSGACTDFNVPDYNKTSLQDLQSNPTPAGINAAVRGLLFRSRRDAENIVVTLGQYGREGVNLNAQNGTLPDYLIGPVTSGTFYIGQSMWAPPYSGIRTANVIPR